MTIEIYESFLLPWRAMRWAMRPMMYGSIKKVEEFRIVNETSDVVFVVIVVAVVIVIVVVAVVVNPPMSRQNFFHSTV